MLDNGTINGGTISTTGSAQLGSVIQQGGTFNSVTLAGTLSEQAQVTKLSINGGLTLNGGTILMANINDVTFNGTQTLGGTGTIVYNNGDNRDRIDVGGTGSVLTIGPNITVRGNACQFNADGGSIINQGTIDDDTGGATLTLNGSWLNVGTIEASGAGSLSFAESGRAAANSRRQMVGRLAATARPTNTGRISVANGSLYLGGTFTVASLGQLTRSGGSVYLTGTC